MDHWRHLQREWGTSVQPLKKPTVPTVLAHRQFMVKSNYTLLKGLSHEIDFKNVDENGQILALLRAAAGF